MGVELNNSFYGQSNQEQKSKWLVAQEHRIIRPHVKYRISLSIVVNVNRYIDVLNTFNTKCMKGFSKQASLIGLCTYSVNPVKTCQRTDYSALGCRVE